MNEIFDLEVLESETTLDFTDAQTINFLNKELGL